MSELQKFFDILMKDEEKILKKSPYQDIVNELTADEKYKDELLRIATITIRMIDKDISFKDYKMAISMIEGIVDTMLMHLMEKYDLEFIKRK